VEFSEFSVEKNVSVIFEPCYTCSFTDAVILHTVMVTILIMVVSETVLLVTVCKCVLSYFFLFFCFLLFLCFLLVAFVANKGI